MHEVIEEIVEELSRRIPSGIIDLTNEHHIHLLENIMRQIIQFRHIL